MPPHLKKSRTLTSFITKVKPSSIELDPFEDYDLAIAKATLSNNYFGSFKGVGSFTTEDELTTHHEKKKKQQKQN